MSKLDMDELRQLKQDNMIIFEKCKNAVLSNGFSAEKMNNALEYLKIFGGNENERV